MNSAGNERKAIRFRQLQSRLLADAGSKWAEVADTGAVQQALRELPETFEVYPYWRQRAMWKKGELPGHIVLVYWDARQEEGDAVEGFVGRSSRSRCGTAIASTVR